MFSKFRKTDRKKPVSDTDINVFSSILQNFQEQLFYWTPPVAVSVSFKASGFKEAVMLISFWISHDIVYLNILSSSWSFCAYFWQAKAFRCILAASLKYDLIYFFWQRRIEVSWYLDYPISFCANLYCNNHTITSILLSLRSTGLEKVEI